jgi:hypothetical protein
VEKNNCKGPHCEVFHTARVSTLTMNPSNGDTDHAIIYPAKPNKPAEEAALTIALSMNPE